MTGARPGELLNLKWADVNRQWKGMAIRDKVEVDRVIPLTPYVASLLQGLTKAGARVFSTARTGAAAKKHYKIWPFELLRMHHEKIEAWMLEQAGVQFKPSEGAPLRVLA